jgi:MFS family permease
MRSTYRLPRSVLRSHAGPLVTCWDWHCVDRFAPRVVLSTQFGALAIALAVNSAVGAPWLLCLVVGVVGAGSSVGAQLSAVGGRFADPRRRATVLGIVTSGISAGILAGRVVGGWLTDVMGWRGMLSSSPSHVR